MPGSNTNVFGPKLGGLDASAAAVIPPVATNAAASSAPAIPAGNSRPGFILSFPPQKTFHRKPQTCRFLGHRITTSTETLRSRDDRPARIVYAPGLASHRTR